ncbi:hypothetical protein BOTBODRAFT_70043 [Botryobasidium botryosum FD-172 SS1]|uniref:Uncharacterized protein n=1 Tax=Botryobasidium botryosum (strain FD-172 SS1) TaxID=930990 RepID=A0A067LX71_BOTB1|nr:hypothetical protein BOTBODRAFT_70043 [Botryobasidium botryosum FD-172 SS1]
MIPLPKAWSFPTAATQPVTPRQRTERAWVRMKPASALHRLVSPSARSVLPSPVQVRIDSFGRTSGWRRQRNIHSQSPHEHKRRLRGSTDITGPHTTDILTQGPRSEDILFRLGKDAREGFSCIALLVPPLVSKRFRDSYISKRNSKVPRSSQGLCYADAPNPSIRSRLSLCDSGWLPL